MIGDEHIDAFLDTLKNPTYFPHLKRVVIKASSFNGPLWHVVNMNSKSMPAPAPSTITTRITDGTTKL